MERGPELPTSQNPSQGQRKGWEGTGQLGGHRLRAELGQMGGGPAVSNTQGRKAPSLSPFNEHPVLTLVLSSG